MKTYVTRAIGLLVSKILVIAAVLVVQASNAQAQKSLDIDCDSAEDSGRLSSAKAFRIETFLPKSGLRESELVSGRKVYLDEQDQSVKVEFYDGQRRAQKTVKYTRKAANLGTFDEIITYDAAGQEISREPASSDLWAGSLIHETKIRGTVKSEYSRWPDCSRTIRTDYNEQGRELGFEITVVLRDRPEIINVR